MTTDEKLLIFESLFLQEIVLTLENLVDDIDKLVEPSTQLKERYTSLDGYSLDDLISYGADPKLIHYKELFAMVEELENIKSAMQVNISGLLGVRNEALKNVGVMSE